MSEQNIPPVRDISRREALAMLGAGAAIVLVGCGSSSTSSSSSGSGSASSCVLSPNLTIGPYFVDERLNRSDLTTNTTDSNVINGVPLTLNLTVVQYSSSGCSALQDAQVDVWHADAGGVYSDESVENTLGETYLRGYQVTDAPGLVTFKTIFPGWYSGRTIHIHIMIRTFSSSGSQTFEFTTQLFFNQTVINSVMTRAPYSSRGTPDTTNASDSIYSSKTQVALTGDVTSGYATSFTIGVQTS